MELKKIYGYHKTVYQWSFVIPSKHDPSESKEELEKLISSEFIDIIEKILANSEEMFRIKYVAINPDQRLYPPKYIKKCDQWQRQEIIKKITNEEVINELRRIENEENHNFALLYLFGESLISFKDSEGNIHEKWISKDSEEYINPYDKEKKHGPLPYPLEISLSFYLPIKPFIPETLEYVLDISTHTDVWYDTSAYYSRVNKKRDNSNNDDAIFNRGRLFEFLSQIKNTFPNAKIEEELEEVVWKYKEPKITLLDMER